MKKSNYKIVERESGGHGGLFELEYETYFDVVEIKTGKILMTFERSSSASYTGAGWGEETHGGVRTVLLGEDGKSVQVFWYGREEPETVVIPMSTV